MHTLLPKRRVKVPSHLAVIAALLLSAASFSGFMNTREANQPAQQNAGPVATESNSVDVKPASNKRKLTLSSLLFGQG